VEITRVKWCKKKLIEEKYFAVRFWWFSVFCDFKVAATSEG
jgi:hypothetical protein